MTERLIMRVETPRFGFVKWTEAGTVDFVSPFPCPFNYGSIPGTTAPDGGARDALHLDRRRRRAGSLLEGDHVLDVCFVDGGVRDDKSVLANRPPTSIDRLRLETFFVTYAAAKRVLARMRGRSTDVRFLGLRAPGAP